MSRVAFILTIFVTGSSSWLSAAPIRWTTGPGANGHIYDVRHFPSAGQKPVGGLWQQANDAAAAAGGYLATIESAEENAFVFGLVDAPEFWRVPTESPVFDNFGPWLGGLQPDGFAEPDQGWKWVPPTDTNFEFTNWALGEPNNFPAGAGGLGVPNDESRLHFFGPSPGEMTLGPRAATWNDLAGFEFNGEKGLRLGDAPIGYVVEWVPEPSALTSLSALCLVGVAVVWWRRRRR